MFGSALYSFILDFAAYLMIFKKSKMNEYKVLPNIYNDNLNYLLLSSGYILSIYERLFSAKVIK